MAPLAKVEKIRVCLLSPSFPKREDDPGGVFVFRLARTLVEQGVEARVLAPSDSLSSAHEVISGLEVLRFQYAIPRRLQKLTQGYGGIPFNLERSLIARIQVPCFLSSFALASLRWSKDCDIIHAQWIGTGLIGLVSKMLLRKPVLVTVRGSDVKIMTGTRVLRTLCRFVLRCADGITTVSRRLEDAVFTTCPGLSNISFVPNGVDIDRFRPLNRLSVRKRLGLPARRTIVVYVGNFSYVKGLDYLLDSISIVRERREPPLFLLVGDGEGEGRLGRKITAHAISDCVYLAGIRPASEIPLWMNAADVLVLPSLSEGRPNVVLEAMACEVPVVATAVGGTPELVRDGEVGFLIPPRDPQAIAEKILLLLGDQGLRERLGRNGRRFILEQGLTWESCARKYSEIYRALIERSRGGEAERASWPA